MMSGGATASYVYDGDGNCVKAMVNSTTNVYVGNHYEGSGHGEEVVHNLLKTTGRNGLPH